MKNTEKLKPNTYTTAAEAALQQGKKVGKIKLWGNE